MHKDPSPYAGKTVKIKDSVFQHGGKEIEIRDWWDRCSGYGWKTGILNPICTSYMMRASMTHKIEMFNNEVLYGKIGNFMHLIHVSEIEEPAKKGKKNA